MTEIPDERMEFINLNHLLSMSCGLDWHELGEYSEFGAWINSPDQIEYILNKPMVHQPGEQFIYSDGAAHLVSVIVSEATGMSTLDFAAETLFDPLGIGQSTLLEDNRGYNIGGAGLSVTPHDMIKFGNLFLNRGVINGRQIINPDWIDLSTSQKITTQISSPYGSDYGYYWWLDQAIDFYFATGYGGQFIVVVPEYEAVIVATCQWSGIGRDNANNQWIDVYELIIFQVIPAFL